MTILPNWDSIQSTERWSDILFWAGIVCLILLAATEVASHIYGSRAAELRGEATRTAERQRQEDADAAESRRKAEVGALQKQLSEADKKLTDVQKQQAPRRLSDEQHKFLISQLSPFRGQKIELVGMLGDQESLQFADDFLAVFLAAGWQVIGGGVNQAVISGTGAMGIELTINKAEADAGRIPPVLQLLVNVLTEAKLLPPASEGRPNAFANPESPPDHVVFRVGTKPPPK